jgi:acyl-ACP thioesterase
MNILSENITVGFTDVDPSGRITLFSLFDYFQKASIKHAEMLGVGREYLKARVQVWVLSRMSVIIERRPALDEKCVLNTWPRSFEKLFAIRDYDIKDTHGNILVRGRSGWLLLDIEKRRPLRPRESGVELPLNEGLDSLDFAPPGLNSPQQAEKAGERKTVYSDIDFNAHVNNARYIQWLQDFLPAGTLENADSIRLDINYLNELKQGDIVSFYSAQIHLDKTEAKIWRNALSFEGRKENGEAAFRAELRIS